MVDRIALGRWGEDVAVRHLEAQGYEVLARNWRCRYGEIDVVARHGDALVFVEVKTRSGVGFGAPAEAVTPRKVARLRLLAGQWLVAEKPRGWDSLRLDVVSVLRQGAEAPTVEHLQAVA